MTIYIIDVEYQDHKTGQVIFNKTANLCYKTLDAAINHVRAQSDYKASINSYLHYGYNHRWTIRSVTLI